MKPSVSLYMKIRINLKTGLLYEPNEAYPKTTRKYNATRSQPRCEIRQDLNGENPTP